VTQGDDSEFENEKEDEDDDCAVVDEIDVSEHVVLEEKGPQILKTLLLGLPSPTSLFWSLVTVLVNLALVGMTLDMIYRAPVLFQAHDLSFTRVGYVSADSAKLLIREPNPKELPIYVRYRYADSPLKSPSGHSIPDTTWKYAATITGAELDEESDFTSSAYLHNLHPDTRYQYALSNNHSGHFYTAPMIGHVSRRNDGKFTFLHSSCIKPRTPYNPMDHALHFPGFRHLADWIPKLKAHFMLFLGDFIYADVPHRFGDDVESFRSEYRRVYASPDWPSVSDDLPWIHVLDDHEIANDWDKNTTGLYLNAADPWENYHVAANPPPARVGHTWFTFTQGPASFFMMDTRRYRTPENDDPNDANASMLGKEQLTDLIKFLHAPNPRGVKWKIVISSIPFTKNWRFGGKDTWGGYLVERQIVLEAMWEVGAKGTGVVVLSGDRHEFAATSFPPPEGGEWPQSATVYEFSTSPLSMFYLPVRTYKQTDQEDVTIK
jgi:alkaline phosphatase D